MSNADLQKEFDDHMNENCPDITGQSFVIALSGGVDSTALALMAQKWASSHRDVTLICVIVDHQLRSESSIEAELTAKRFTDLGFEHVIIRVWPKDEHPEKVTQSDARQARYEILETACQNYRAGYVLLGQHLDDQAETFLYRLFKASGLDGLCAMSVKSKKNGLIYLRPMLNMRKSELKSYCRDMNIKWVEDPSNGSDKYIRTSIRSLYQNAENVGLDVKHVNTSIKKINAAQSYIDDMFMAFCDVNIRVSTHGFAIMQLDAYMRLHPYMKVFVLKKLLSMVAGSVYPPRQASLEKLVEHIEQGAQKIMTLHGCVLDNDMDEDAIYFYREKRAMAPTVTLEAGQSTIWDQKYQVTWHGHGNIELCPAYQKQSSFEKLADQTMIEQFKSYPKPVRDVALSIWQGDVLLSLPLISMMGANDKVEITPIFARYEQIKIV